MLPSGNDAAYVLAENFGYVIKCIKNNHSNRIDHIRSNNYILDHKKDKFSNDINYQ